MPEIVTVGPFMLKAVWLITAVACAAGFLAMYWKWKRSEQRREPMIDKIVNAVLLIILIWKISPFIFNPKLLWESPMLGLKSPGSMAGAWIAIAAAVLYLELDLRRKGLVRLALLDLLSIGTVTASAVFSLLRWQYGTLTELPWGIAMTDPQYHYHPLNIYLLMVCIPVWIRLWMLSPAQLGLGKIFSEFLLSFGAGLMMVSYFQPGDAAYFGMTLGQIVYVLMMLGGLGLSVYVYKRAGRASTT